MFVPASQHCAPRFSSSPGKMRLPLRIQDVSSPTQHVLPSSECLLEPINTPLVPEFRGQRPTRLVRPCMLFFRVAQLRFPTQTLSSHTWHRNSSLFLAGLQAFSARVGSDRCWTRLPYGGQADQPTSCTTLPEDFEFLLLTVSPFQAGLSGCLRRQPFFLCRLSP